MITESRPLLDTFTTGIEGGFAAENWQHETCATLGSAGILVIGHSGTLFWPVCIVCVQSGCDHAEPAIISPASARATRLPCRIIEP